MGNNKLILKEKIVTRTERFLDYGKLECSFFLSNLLLSFRKLI